MQADRRGDVEDAGDADRRIDQEAADRGGGAAGVALHHLVDRRHRLAEIVEHVVHAALRGRRHPVAIEHRERPDGDDVDGPVDREDEAVGRLERIPRLVRAGIAAGAATQQRRRREQRRWPNGEARAAIVFESLATMDAEQLPKRLCFAARWRRVSHTALHFEALEGDDVAPGHNSGLVSIGLQT